MRIVHINFHFSKHNNNNNNDNNNNNNNNEIMIIPVVIGATGIVMRSLRKNLEDIPGKHLIDSLQKLYLEHHT